MVEIVVTNKRFKMVIEAESDADVNDILSEHELTDDIVKKVKIITKSKEN